MGVFVQITKKLRSLFNLDKFEKVLKSKFETGFSLCFVDVEKSL